MTTVVDHYGPEPIVQGGELDQGSVAKRLGDVG
jgi:hypothetical protein